MDQLFAKFQPLVLKYKNSPNHEIEFRLGKVQHSKFDTNVGKDVYMRVLRRLHKYQGWESTKVTNDMVYYSPDGRRGISNMDTGDVECMTKKKVEDLNFLIDDRPFDVRLGISTEVPYELKEDEEFEKTKQRTRHSFVRKNLSIDVSMVKENPEDMDAESDTTFQIELEIQDPSKIQNDNELFNIMHKIFDVLDIV